MSLQEKFCPNGSRPNALIMSISACFADAEAACGTEKSSVVEGIE
jgi:hypothetical protein